MHAPRQHSPDAPAPIAPARWGLSAQMNMLYQCGVLRACVFEPDPEEAMGFPKSFFSGRAYAWDRDDTSERLNVIPAHSGPCDASPKYACGACEEGVARRDSACSLLVT